MSVPVSWTEGSSNAGGIQNRPSKGRDFSWGILVREIQNSTVPWPRCCSAQSPSLWDSSATWERRCPWEAGRVGKESCLEGQHCQHCAAWPGEAASLPSAQIPIPYRLQLLLGCAHRGGQVCNHPVQKVCFGPLQSCDLQSVIHLQLPLITLITVFI